MNHNVEKDIDTNILVYALVEGHPATSACEEFIRRVGEKKLLVTTPLTPFGIYYVLWRIYGLCRNKACEQAVLLFDSPIELIHITEEDVCVALRKVVEHSIEANDALLLVSCLQHSISSLASDDTRLLKACQKEGVHTEEPIDTKISQKMEMWEKDKLPEKGAQRMLLRVYNWLLDTDPKVADEFKQATGDMERLP
ncbi:MAG: type II toxin-antitoxin system VapC family toxin [Candidatus Jordarchaeum sp.]|uniref:type II toxin-antitoxin system VapC family toxin n=1 Tax=Candidatus Jordarchaeum sp. TaxID=2823881 RepID=UPI00404A1E7A